MNWIRGWRISWILAIAMTNSVKLFQGVRKYLRTIGIYPPQPGQRHSFNSKNIFFLFCLIISFFGVALFFIFQAKTSAEFSISFYESVTLLTVIGLFTINICKASNIFNLIETMDEFVEKSKWMLLNFTSQNPNLI